MLEDDFTYVLRKALTGHGLTTADAAARAGMDESALAEFLGGRFPDETARAVAPVLGLNPEAFARHARYQPGPLALSCIQRLDLPFGGERVNAWLVRRAGTLVLFDAGYRAADLLAALPAMPDRVFITHAHRDHTGAVDHFLRSGIPVHSAELPGTIHMNPGDVVCCGPLTLSACDLSGHASP